MGRRLNAWARCVGGGVAAGERGGASVAASALTLPLPSTSRPRTGLDRQLLRLPPDAAAGGGAWDAGGAAVERRDARHGRPPNPLSLSSQDPVITPSGVLYSREAILKSLLDQKKAAKRRLAAWRSATDAATAAADAQGAADQAARVAAFERTTNAGASASAAAAAGKQVADAAAPQSRGRLTAAHATAYDRERAATMKADWAAAPEGVAAGPGPKPESSTKCPATGAPLRLKDLTPAVFARPAERDAGGAFAVDPVTRAPLTNAATLVCLLPGGHIMTLASYDACVKQDGAYEGVKVESCVELARGGTGFAAHDGRAAAASRSLPLGPGTGRADVRGQLGTGGSKFGLKIS